MSAAIARSNGLSRDADLREAIPRLARRLAGPQDPRRITRGAFLEPLGQPNNLMAAPLPCPRGTGSERCYDQGYVLVRKTDSMVTHGRYGTKGEGTGVKHPLG